jgi:hypothetical protein
MFTLIAVETHRHEEGELGHEVMEAVHEETHPGARPAPAH